MKIYAKGMNTYDEALDARRRILQGETPQTSGERKLVDTHIRQVAPEWLIKIVKDWNDANPVRDFDCEWGAEQLRAVFEAADMRDAPVEDLSILWTGEYYDGAELRTRHNGKYAPRVDYGTDAESYRKIQRGDKIPTPEFASYGLPVTHRDIGTQMEHDNCQQYGGAYLQLRQMGTPINPGLVRDRSSAFIAGGDQWALSVIAEVRKYALMGCFVAKWLRFVPRPEEIAGDLMLDPNSYPVLRQFFEPKRFLPLGYAAGSPTHTADPAAHAGSAYGCTEAMACLLDCSHMLTSGRTVDAELDLFAYGNSYARVDMGVHFPQDHENGKSLGRLINAEVIRRNILPGTSMIVERAGRTTVVTP